MRTIDIDNIRKKNFSLIYPVAGVTKWLQSVFCSYFHLILHIFNFFLGGGGGADLGIIFSRRFSKKNADYSSDFFLRPTN